MRILKRLFSFFLVVATCASRSETTRDPVNRAVVKGMTESVGKTHETVLQTFASDISELAGLTVDASVDQCTLLAGRVPAPDLVPSVPPSRNANLRDLSSILNRRVEDMRTELEEATLKQRNLLEERVDWSSNVHNLRTGDDSNSKYDTEGAGNCGSPIWQERFEESLKALNLPGGRTGREQCFKTPHWAKSFVKVCDFDLRCMMVQYDQAGRTIESISASKKRRAENLAMVQEAIVEGGVAYAFNPALGVGALAAHLLIVAQQYTKLQSRDILKTMGSSSDTLQGVVMDLNGKGESALDAQKLDRFLKNPIVLSSSYWRDGMKQALGNQDLADFSYQNMQTEMQNALVGLNRQGPGNSLNDTLMGISKQFDQGRPDSVCKGPGGVCLSDGQDQLFKLQARFKKIETVMEEFCASGKKKLAAQTSRDAEEIVTLYSYLIRFETECRVNKLAFLDAKRKMLVNLMESMRHMCGAVAGQIVKF